MHGCSLFFLCKRRLYENGWQRSEQLCEIRKQQCKNVRVQQNPTNQKYFSERCNHLQLKIVDFLLHCSTFPFLKTRDYQEIKMEKRCSSVQIMGDPHYVVDRDLCGPWEALGKTRNSFPVQHPRLLDAKEYMSLRSMRKFSGSILWNEMALLLLVY